jgi:hypothetical protein
MGRRALANDPDTLARMITNADARNTSQKDCFNRMSPLFTGAMNTALALLGELWSETLPKPRDSPGGLGSKNGLLKEIKELISVVNGLTFPGIPPEAAHWRMLSGPVADR